MSPTFHGVDCYHGNEINGALPAMEVFVHKLSEGRSFQDPKAAARLTLAAASAVRRGGYHWLRSDATVEAQVANFQKAVTASTLTRNGELLPNTFLMLDWERTIVNGKPIPDPPLDMVEHWCSLVQGLYGERLIMYTSDWVTGYQTWRARNPSFPLWYANYVTDPKRPDGGPQECVKYRATCWQYTSKAVVPGFKNPVDANTILDFAGLDRLCHTPVPDPKPPTTPKPPTPKPLPDLGGEMKNGIIRCVDDGTTFVGVLNDKGAALEVRWTGPGTTDVFRWLDNHRAQGAVDIEVAKTGLSNCCLNGPVPPGWSLSDFAPPSR